MTHSTVWINGNVEFNENLADFVGDYGAIRFLESKYGKNSKEYRRYVNGNQDSEKYYQHILRGAHKLDSLYQSFKPQTSKKVKEEKKWNLIKEIVAKLDTIQVANKKSFGKRVKKELPNNAFFMSFRRYRSQQNQFEKEFKEKFNSNFPKYLAYLKKKYS
jgi:predicted aminopeptidase